MAGLVRSLKIFSIDDDFLNGLRLSLPILFGFFPVGLAFGIVATEQGLSPFLTMLTSIAIYAGSSEFVVVAMIAGGESLVEIALAGFFLNFRHIFYGFSVSGAMPDKGIGRYFCIWTLSDEAFALLSALKSSDKKSALGICFFIHSYWYVSVAIGVFAGDLIPFDLEGLEFCLTALFTVLTIDQYIHAKSKFPFIVGTTTAVIALLFVPSQMLVTAICFTALFIIVDGFYEKNRRLRRFL